ncbi:hypothetical protein BGW38_001885 [Lunasporangiospora selenospora]|uniref:30S ribosomal protein S15 n=1 Tax=Lunasporangiospora selenospora TaxID=979761 RepID=A0A9P6G135_9FUNG|nr:hypothetical protein BGW38_001885 [Lunasporangiospora selenospora]
MFRSALTGARSLAASAETTPCKNFHTSAAALAKSRRSRKDIAVHVRKLNLEKQEKKLIEYENSTPDYIIGKQTDFTQSLMRPQAMFQTPLEAIKPADAESHADDGSSSALSASSSIFSTSSRKPTVVSTSNPAGYQHFLTKDEVELIFDSVPQVQVQEMILRSSLVNEKTQLPVEKQKAEIVRRITALENASAKQIMLENVRRARESFQRMEGDTGSPEVQAAVMTARIHNLYDHVRNNKKDKHNYRRLRMLIHQRQTVLKYLKKTDPSRYHVCLDRLGLEPRAIEDEIVI